MLFNSNGFSFSLGLSQNFMGNRFGKLIKLSIILIFFLTFYSCQKDTTINSSNSLDEGNYLIFQDRDKLLEVFEKLVNNDELISSYAKDNGYTSSIQMLENFEILANEENVTSSELSSYIENSDVLHVSEDSSVELILEDPVFSTLINQRGLIQVSDTLFKFRRDDIVAIPIEIKTGQPVVSIEEAENFTETNESLGITIIPIIRSVTNSYSKSEGCDKKCTEGYASKRRLKGKLWKLNLYLVKMAGAYTKSQKKVWFWWSRTNAPLITVQVAPPDYDLPYNNYKHDTCKNCKEAGFVTSYSFWVSSSSSNPYLGPQVPDTSLSLNGEHFLTNQNGTFECTTCRK